MNHHARRPEEAVLDLSAVVPAKSSCERLPGDAAGKRPRAAGAPRTQGTPRLPDRSARGEETPAGTVASSRPFERSSRSLLKRSVGGMRDAPASISHKVRPRGADWR